MTTTLQEPVTLDPHKARRRHPGRDRLVKAMAQDPDSTDDLMSIAAVLIEGLRRHVSDLQNDLAEAHCIESISTRNGRITRIDLAPHEFRGVKDAIREHQAAVGRDRGLLPVKGMECVADCGDLDVDEPVGESFEER